MTNKELHDKNTRILLIVFGVVIGMTALAFASVPLYNMFCRATGFGGTTQTSNTAPDIILDRQINVQFLTDVNSKLHWDFKPDIPKIDLHVGQEAFINFKAWNKGNETVAGTAIYNVTPQKAGKYFSKIQCFCFDYQILKPGQHMNMPVIFYLDPAMQDDPDMEDVKTITLSYSFFKADSPELEKAIAAMSDN